jgi:polyvinyl alcohol dehydrogenase (cytochrome)
MRIPRLVALAVPCLLPCAVLAAVAGGGPASQDCQLELDTPKPNYPLSLPDKPRVPKELRCFDGDAGCDVDGEVNGTCRFPLDACFRVSDPALPCTPADVTSFAVGGANGNADLRALQQAGQALLPATASACTTGQGVRVALRGRGKKPARRTVKLKARTGAGTDSDKVALTCLPHGWPSYGYDHRNRRATPVETTLSPANANRIETRWTFDIAAHEGGGTTQVSSTPTVANGMVFVTSWNGKVYGLRARDGRVRWRYDTGSGQGGLGVQSSATLTPEGRLLVGDSFGITHCLVAKTGALLWTASVADTDPAASHIWGSPVVANGRVFVGRASHTDQPCTQGHLYAFDLDTGAELWRYKTVPDRVCHNDTRVTCTTDADCGGAACVPGIGGGVTATVAVDPTGDTVYMGSVGCYTSPSIGNSDSLFALDATTGTAHWIYRTESIEQYRERGVYHDFGFLNGPLLVDASDGAGGTRRLVVGPSKDGTIYAVDPTSGALVWSYSLVPMGSFAGFGLFNAATAWANDTLYASLFQTIVPPWPATNDHLYAFAGQDGTPRWSAQIGPSWSPVAVANGLVFVGTREASEYYVHDAATGARLKTLPMQTSVLSGASVVDGVVYVGYGGGVVALGLP